MSSSLSGGSVATRGREAADPVAEVAPLDAAKAVSGALIDVAEGAASGTVLVACAVRDTNSGAQSHAVFPSGALVSVGAGAASLEVLIGGALDRADETAASAGVWVGDVVGGFDADAAPPASLVGLIAGGADKGATSAASTIGGTVRGVSTGAVSPEVLVAGALGLTEAFGRLGQCQAAYIISDIFWRRHRRGARQEFGQVVRCTWFINHIECVFGEAKSSSHQASA